MDRGESGGLSIKSGELRRVGGCKHSSFEDVPL